MKTPSYHQGEYGHPPSSAREADRVKNNPVCFTIDQVWMIIDGGEGAGGGTEKGPRGNSIKEGK